MSDDEIVMLEEEFLQITQILKQLLRDTESKVVFLFDKDGRLIAAEGETKTPDTTSLATLTGGNIAATGGLSKLLEKKEFSILFEEAGRDSLHISVIGDQVILVVVFDKRSNLEKVRFEVKGIIAKLEMIFKKLSNKNNDNSPGSGEGGIGGPGGSSGEMTLSIFDTDPPKESLN